MPLHPGLSALRIPYLIVRTPLGLLDEHVVVRVFGADSTAHRSLAQGLRSLDDLASNVFDGAAPTAYADDDLFAADDRFEPDEGPDSQAPDSEAPDSEAPDSEPSDALTSPTAAPEPAREQERIDSDEQRQIDELAQTYIAADELAPRAGELAEDDEVRRVQAEIRAKQNVEDQRGQL